MHCSFKFSQKFLSVHSTNWVIQILHEMVCIVKNKEAPLEQSWIEYGNVQSLEKLKIRPSPRIIASHLYFQNLPKSFFEKKVKTVLILRNPKDAAVSYYKFHNSLPALPNYESWDMFFKDYISGNVSYGSYFDFMSSWNSHIDDSHVLPVKFEDLKADLHSQLKRIAKFLGLSLAEEQISVVESRTSFTTMKGKSGDTHKKLADSFFRKGQVGDWKSLFTEEQSKAIDVKFEQNLAGTKLGSLIEYSKYCTF
ncbi:sulfotransferase 6B1-like [Gastrophryne carolinensis]